MMKKKHLSGEKSDQQARDRDREMMKKKKKHLSGEKSDQQARALAQLPEQSENENLKKQKEVGDGRALQGKITAPFEELEVFPSRHSLLEWILGALKDPAIARIGVYGMPGVGKTVLLQHVRRIAMEERMFDEVVMVPVSSRPDIRTIQGDLADALGLKFVAETTVGRSMELHHQLMNGLQRILVILDDIYQELKLEDIGISYKQEKDGRYHPGMVRCKILMAARRQDVLCDKKSDKNFEVAVLSREAEVRLLPQEVASILDGPYYRGVADEEKWTAVELATAAVAKLLPGDTSRDAWGAKLQKVGRPFTTKVWEPYKRLGALYDKLKSSHPNRIVEFGQIVFKSLELSYKRLGDREAQQLFLLCGILQPQYGDIYVSELLKYSVGLGLLRYVRTLSEARERVDALLHKLKASRLLLEGETDEVVKMHDLVREMSRHIAGRSDQYAFVVHRETDFGRLPIKEKLIHSRRLSVQFSGIRQLPEDQECPQLEFLKLYTPNPPLTIPDGYFQQMTGLKVLSLTGMKILSSLPTSLHSLTDLQTLCLDWCHGIRDMSVLGKLQQLAILSIVGSDIEELPGDLTQLIQLKLLDLSNCSKLKVIPKNFFSNLAKLEELYMGNSFDQWGVEGNASLSELHNLHRLTTLHIHVQHVEMIPVDLHLEKLMFYEIVIGDRWNWSGSSEQSRKLKLKLERNPYYSGHNNVQELMETTEDLCLDELRVDNVLYELHRQGLPSLKKLYLQNNSFIRYIINFVEGFSDPIAFPSLNSLVLNGLSNLEKICGGLPKTQVFMSLRSIEIVNCRRIKSLFSSSMAKYLLRLQKIEVTDCENIVDIFSLDMDDDTERIKDKQFRSPLQCLTLRGLPQFVSLYPANDLMLLSQLEELHLSMIDCGKIWPVISGTGLNLTKLIVDSCNGLTHLFSVSSAASLMQLKQLQVSRCRWMRAIVVETGEEFNDEVFPRLNSLVLEHLEGLTEFYRGNDRVVFPSLKQLKIASCPRLEVFISSRVSILFSSFDRSSNSQDNFPSLEDVRISSMGNPIALWHHRVTYNRFSRLKTVEIKNCQSLVVAFPSNSVLQVPSLEILHIEDCDSVKFVFEFDFSYTQRKHIHPGLKVLRCWSLPRLMQVWSHHDQMIFEGLQEVSIWQCERLTYVFPDSVPSGFPKLEKLSVSHCERMEEIVEGEQDISSMFPLLYDLTLWELPCLKWFHSAGDRVMHTTSQWQRLKRLRVKQGDKVTSELETSAAETATGADDRDEPSSPWELFCRHARGLVLTPNLHQLAEQIVNICKGNPLAVTLMARFLKNHVNDIILWEDVVDRLRTQVPFEVQGVAPVLVDAFILIWDHMDGLKRECIRYYAFNSNIINNPVFITANWVLDGRLSSKTWERTLVLEELSEAFVFQQPMTLNSVSLHPEIREIVSCLLEKRGTFILKQGNRGLTEPPEEAAWDTMEFCLMGNSFSKLPNSPNCPSLISLYLQNNTDLTSIPPLFFSRMPALKVLNLSDTSIKSLPPSVSNLLSLQKLHLRNCELLMELPQQVGELENLEELDLDKTPLIELPESVGKLYKLKLLRVSFYGYDNRSKRVLERESMIHPGTLARLHQLSDLSIEVDPDDERWQVDVDIVIEEACNLKSLTCLRLHLPTVEKLWKHTRSGASLIDLPLSHFTFTVGHLKNRLVSSVPRDMEILFQEQEKCLKLVKVTGVSSELKRAVQKSTSLLLHCHVGAKSLSDFGIENVSRLKFCLLAECNDITTLVGPQRQERLLEAAQGSALENLERLSAYYMNNLEILWERPIQPNCLANLQFLALHKCPKLSNIFSARLLENLGQLQELVVDDCRDLTTLVAVPAKEAACSSSSDSAGPFLPKLNRLALLHLPKFVSISSGLRVGSSVETLVFYDCPELRSITPAELSSTSLRAIKGEQNWWINLGLEKLEWKEGQLENILGKFSPIEALPARF